MMQEECSDEEVQVIAMDPSKLLSAHKRKKYEQPPLYYKKSLKICAIFLLLILCFSIYYSLMNIRLLTKQSLDNEPNQQTSFSINDAILQASIHREQTTSNNEDIHDAKKVYIAAKERMTELTPFQQMEEIDDFLKAKYELEALVATQNLDPLALELFENGKSDSKFIIPHIVWIYLTRLIETQSYINFLTITANSRIAKSNNYTLNILTKQNYANFLSKVSSQQLEHSIEFAQKAGRSIEDIQHITKYLIIAAILEEFGGIFVDEQVLLLEGFDWIQEIGNNIFLNRGLKNVEPKVVAFHSIEHSSPLLRQDKQEALSVKQYMRVFPAIEHYFLAAHPHSNYFKDLMRQLRDNISKNDTEIEQIVIRLRQNNAYKNDGNFSIAFWKDIFIISSQQILINKQNRLLLTNSETLFAIDSYGLKTINKYYFPYKLEFIFAEDQPKKTFIHLARHTLQELEATVGPLRYLAIIAPRNKINEFLEEVKSSNSKQFIIQGSFLQIYLFNNTNQSFIVPNPEKPQKIVEAPQWNKLPKFIWLFWDKGLSSSHATNQLAKRNIEKYAALSEFKVIQVNQTNLQEYLSLEEIKRIEDILYSKGKSSKFDQTYSDLIRLALIKQHGGIYMDASFLLLQDLSWLIDIAAYPSQFVFNRYGELPSVFMFHNPHYGSPYDEWQVDTTYNTKALWHLSYENNFIASEPKNKLIIAWFDTLVHYLTQPYSQTEQQFRDCGILQNKWSSPENTYLLPMDTIKCVIGKKEKELKDLSKQDAISQASQYYKVWSISGYNGVQKFRKVTNFEMQDSEDNLFFRRNSIFFVDSLMGKPRELVKLYRFGNLELNNFIMDNIQGKIFGEIHYQSYFNKYMFSLRENDEDFLIIKDNILIKEKQ